MNALPERKMRIGIARNIERIRIGEHAFITVRRRKQDANRCAAALARGLPWSEVGAGRRVRSGGRRGSSAVEAVLGGQTFGFLPLACVRSLLFGRFLVSLPYLNTNGVIALAAAIRSCSELNGPSVLAPTTIGASLTSVMA